MSLSIPSFNIPGFIDKRHQVRSEVWEPNFEKNYQAFSEQLSLNIVAYVIEKLEKGLKDPYRKEINSENKFVSIISLDITDSKTSRKIKKILPNEGELSPFNEWLETFAKEKKENSYYSRRREIDRKYFQNLMAMVGTQAEEKLVGIFAGLKSQHEHLQFNIKWVRQADQQFSNPSDFMDNCLRIELWAAKEAFLKKAVDQIQTQKMTAIEQHNIRQKKLQAIRMRNYTIMALAIALIGILVLRSGIIEIRLPPPGK